MDSAVVAVVDAEEGVVVLLARAVTVIAGQALRKTLPFFPLSISDL